MFVVLYVGSLAFLLIGIWTLNKLQSRVRLAGDVD